MTLSIAAAVFVALLAGPSRAQDATLSKVSGPVFVRGAGADASLPAKGGESLIYGDSVMTGTGGTAHILLGGDRGAVLVREGSYFTLEGDPQNTTLDFKIGEFLIGLKKRLEKRQAFLVRTPAAVAAVRGTLFWGKSDAALSSTYAGFGHQVWITAQGKTVVLGPGQKVLIGLGHPPTAPAPSGIPVSYAQNFAIDGQLQGLEKLVDKKAAKISGAK